MDSPTGWGEQLKEIEGISGDRRNDRRYEIALELRWKLIRRRRVLDNGRGRTVDLSSGGILIDAGRSLPVGMNLELSIAWPVLLHNVAPLQLIVAGRIVRSAGNRCGVVMVQHEFRTAGVQPENRPAQGSTGHTPPTFLASGGNGAPFVKFR
jgi:hypothetical protein